MSRLSFRPRPLDIHKKLPIVKNFKDFEDDDTPSSTRNSQLLRLVNEPENEVHHVPSKKHAAEIPTPEFVVVDTYERDYSQTFFQPNSYIRARGARAELGEFVEYDLDIEDEDWLQEFNKDKEVLTPEKFENLLFKLEVLDNKARERAGIITTTLGSPIPVILHVDAAAEALQSQSIKYSILESVYWYWKEKRERWQKPILRRLQPPPPVNDTNPYNVFRPREKAHRLNTRRMQRRENNVQSFEKLRQVRRNLDQAKTILEALIKREAKKRDVMETEVSLQRIQLKYKIMARWRANDRCMMLLCVLIIHHVICPACVYGLVNVLLGVLDRHETGLLEDSFVFPSYQPFSKFGYTEDEFMDSEDAANNQVTLQSGRLHTPFVDTKPVMVSAGSLRHDARLRNGASSWIRRTDPSEPVMPFTKALLPDKLAAAGIAPPSDTSNASSSTRSTTFRGRFGRGGRIVFDRWNPLMHTPINC